jgi:hypothetical protein
VRPGMKGNAAQQHDTPKRKVVARFEKPVEMLRELGAGAHTLGSPPRD